MWSLEAKINHFNRDAILSADMLTQALQLVMNLFVLTPIPVLYVKYKYNYYHSANNTLLYDAAQCSFSSEKTECT